MIQASKLHTAMKARPRNCGWLTSLANRCRECGQHHLREGYCQALDPINAERYGKTVTLEPVCDAKPASRDAKDADVTLGECVVCSKRFKAERATAKFCSGACRMRAQRKKAG